jgi:hypothetical protein
MFDHQKSIYTLRCVVQHASLQCLQSVGSLVRKPSQSLVIFVQHKVPSECHCGRVLCSAQLKFCSTCRNTQHSSHSFMRNICAMIISSICPSVSVNLLQGNKRKNFLFLFTSHRLFSGPALLRTSLVHSCKLQCKPELLFQARPLSRKPLVVRHTASAILLAGKPGSTRSSRLGCFFDSIFWSRMMCAKNFPSAFELVVLLNHATIHRRT